MKTIFPALFLAVAGLPAAANEPPVYVPIDVQIAEQCSCGPTCICTPGNTCGCGMTAAPAKRFTTVRVQVCDGRTCHWEDRTVEVVDPPAVKAAATSPPMPMAGPGETVAVASDRPVRQFFGSVRQWVSDHRPHLFGRFAGGGCRSRMP